MFNLSLTEFALWTRVRHYICPLPHKCYLLL